MCVKALRLSVTGRRSNKVIFLALCSGSPIPLAPRFLLIPTISPKLTFLLDLWSSMGMCGSYCGYRSTYEGLGWRFIRSLQGRSSLMAS